MLLLDDEWFFFIHGWLLVILLELDQSSNRWRGSMDIMLPRWLLCRVYSISHNLVVPPLLELCDGLVPFKHVLLMLLKCPFYPDSLLIISRVDWNMLGPLHQLKRLDARVVPVHPGAIIRAYPYLRLWVFRRLILNEHLTLVMTILTILESLVGCRFQVLNLILIVKVVGRSWVILIVPRQVDWLLFHRSFKSWHIDYVFNSHLIDFERSKGWFFLTFAIPIAICLLCFVNLILLFLHEFKQLNIHIFSRLQEPLLLFKEMFRAHDWSFYSWAISWTNSHSHRFFNRRIDLHLWWERVAS